VAGVSRPSHLWGVLTRNRILERYPDDKEKQRIVWQEITLKSRDNGRTPMQVRNFSKKHLVLG
jgi:hypothetical protein